MTKEQKNDVQEIANVLKTTSVGYGYNYASLSDICKQGYTLPKMKTGTESEREYVYYYDSELKEWIRGAEIIIPKLKGSNEAQEYGSALTYARRYTTLMALSLSCEDDKKLEKQKKDDFNDDEEIKTSKPIKMASKSQINLILKLCQDQNKLLSYIRNAYGINDVNDLSISQASELIGVIKNEEVY